MQRRFAAATACLLVFAACSGGSPTGGTGSTGGGQDTLPSYVGTFHAVAHPGAGMAATYSTGSAVELRFTGDFATNANPNLEVWMVAATDVTDNQSVLELPHVSLGPLKSATGTQSYAIPSGLDLTQYRSVTIWCVEAHVNFTTAPLVKQ